MPHKLWHIRNCSLFRRLDVEQLAELGERARARVFPRNSAVYLPSDAADDAFLVAEGRIRICSHTPDGKQAILAFVDPGELFGELALLYPGDREDRAEAAVDSTVVQLPGERLRQMMERSADLTLGVTKLIGLRLQRIERRLRSLLFRSNRDRLAHLLLDLAEQYGRRTDDGILLEIRLSHQDLAAVIGATRETVTTLLGEMQLERLLQVSRQKIVIRDIEKLAVALNVLPPSAFSARTSGSSSELRAPAFTPGPRKNPAG